MSVSLSPSNSLSFKRPLTQLVKRSLSITNHNSQPIAFKVKTTAPKLYCVRPNSGRVEPGENVEVSVMLQPLKEEPPLNAKCKDKFLIQSTLITPEKESMGLNDIWGVQDGSEEAKVHQQKLKVTYQSEGIVIDEEEPQAQPSKMPGESRFDTVRQHPVTNGHSEPMPDFEPPAFEQHRSGTPPGDFTVAREDSQDETTFLPRTVPIAVDDTRYSRSSSPAISELPPAPRALYIREEEPSHESELFLKYNEAQAEIERLKSSLAALSTAALSTAPPTEIRRRHRVLSDDGSVADSDTMTMIDDGPLHQDGVPLQVVVIIALGVFITTYLFF